LWTFLLAGVFAVGLLAVVYNDYVWLRVVGVIVSIGCLVGIPMIRGDLLRAAEIRNPQTQDSRYPTPISVQLWTGCAVLVFLGVTIGSFTYYTPGAATPQPPSVAKHSLRGEAFCNGDKLTITTKTDLLNARIQVRGPDGLSETPVETRALRTQEWTLGQVTGRQPARMTALLKNAEASEKNVVDGKTVEQAEKSPLVGLSADFTRTPPSTAWKKEISPASRASFSRNPDLLREAEADAVGAEAWHPKDELYPGELVAVGHEWVKTGADLRPLLGMEVLSIEGNARFRVAEFIQFKGITCARITFTFTSNGTILDPALGKLKVTLGGSGSVIRSTLHGVDLLMLITGTIEQTWQVIDESGTLNLSLTGSLLIEESTAVERFTTNGVASSPANVTEADQAALTEILKNVTDIEFPSRKPSPVSKPVKVAAGPKPLSVPKPSLPLPKPRLSFPTKGGKAAALIKMLSQVKP